LDWIKIKRISYFPTERDVSEDVWGMKVCKDVIHGGKVTWIKGYVIGGFSWFSWVAWLCSLSGGLSVILYYVWMNVTHWVYCMNILFDKLTGLCYGTLYFQAWCGGVYLLWNYCYAWCGGVLLAIDNSNVLYVGSVCLAWRALGGIKCCVRFFVPRNLVKTLSLVWSSGKGSS